MAFPKYKKIFGANLSKFYPISIFQLPTKSGYNLSSIDVWLLKT